jgi:hypothetical protein
MRLNPALVNLNHLVQIPHSSSLLAQFHLASVLGHKKSPLFYQPEFLALMCE